MLQSTQEHWERFWKNPFPEIVHQQVYNPKLVRILAESLGDLDGKLILEAGAGTALDSIELAMLGGRALACDYSSSALQFAHHRAADLGAHIHLMQGDIRRLPFATETFDAVFHAGVLEHFRHPAEILAEHWRVLKPGGILLVDVPQTYNLYTIYKLYQMRKGDWFAGWEGQFSIGQVESLLADLDFQIMGTYGHGYYPRFLARIRWATSIGKGFAGKALMPERLAKSYEAWWQQIESTRAFLYFAQNIGVVGRKTR